MNKNCVFLLIFATFCALSAEMFSYEEVTKALQPRPWVKANSKDQSTQFELSGQAPFSKLKVKERPSVLANPEEADLQNHLFVTRPEIFMGAQKAKTFREAQLTYFSNREWNESQASFTEDAPGLETWGNLPYPPIRELSSEHAADTSFDHAFDSELNLASGSEWVKNSELKLYQNGDALQGFLKVVDQSQDFLFLNDLSLVCDDKTEPLINAMIAKSISGVDVRIVLNKYYAYLDRACLNRLRESGISIVTVRSHASYIVNDRDDLLVGSESVARMFFASQGFDFLDRDMMLSVQGPSATDALHDFISIWEENRPDSERSSEKPLKLIHEKKLHEMSSAVRGVNLSGANTKGHNLEDVGICRFVSQGPTGGTHEGKIQNLLRTLMDHARTSIFFSGVRFDPNATLVPLLQSKAKSRVSVDLLGNALPGADGELSQYLDEVSDHFKTRGGVLKTLSRVIDFIRNRDALRVAHQHSANFAKIANNTSIESWGYFHFLHYKVGIFDQSSFWIGSLNLDDDNFKNAYESGILCVDPSITQEIVSITTRDLHNSVPYRH